MANIKNNNYKKIDCRLINDNLMDFTLSKCEPSYNTLNENCTAAVLNFKKHDGKHIVSDVVWSEAVASDKVLENIGYTGIDNGFITYQKDRIANDEFLELFTKSKFDLGTYDNRFFVTQVDGNTGDIEYPVELFDEYIAFKGGFYQGFFKIDGDSYQTLPHQINDEWNFAFTIRLKDYETTSNILNARHEENEGIFFYIGTRAENKFWEMYKHSDKLKEYKNDGLDTYSLDFNIWANDVIKHQYVEDEPDFSYVNTGTSHDCNCHNIPNHNCSHDHEDDNYLLDDNYFASEDEEDNTDEPLTEKPDDSASDDAPLVGEDPDFNGVVGGGSHRLYSLYRRLNNSLKVETDEVVDVEDDPGVAEGSKDDSTADNDPSVDKDDSASDDAPVTEKPTIKPGVITTAPPTEKPTIKPGIITTAPPTEKPTKDPIKDAYVHIYNDLRKYDFNEQSICCVDCGDQNKPNTDEDCHDCHNTGNTQNKPCEHCDGDNYFTGGYFGGGHHECHECKEHEHEIIDCTENGMIFDEGYVLEQIQLDKLKLTDSKGFPVGEQGFYEIKTDNKFILFNQTKDGFNIHNWDPNCQVVLTGKTVNNNINYFQYLNRTPTGYTKDNIHQLVEQHSSPYNIFKDIEYNALALKTNKDGSISYRYLSTGGELIEETSKPNLIKKDTWCKIHLKIVRLPIRKNLHNCKQPQGLMKLYIYIDGYLKLVSKELPELNLRPLKDVSEKQEMVPYNISIGGGTQGLIERILLDYYDISDYTLPIEKYFAGTFIGDIKNLTFSPCYEDFAKIKC